MTMLWCKPAQAVYFGFHKKFAISSVLVPALSMTCLGVKQKHEDLHTASRPKASNWSRRSGVRLLSPSQEQKKELTPCKREKSSPPSGNAHAKFLRPDQVHEVIRHASSST